LNEKETTRHTQKQKEEKKGVGGRMRRKEKKKSYLSLNTMRKKRPSFPFYLSLSFFFLP